ncbi:hypothetical protein RFI_34930, partial [Reticulomyxa filosa]
HEEVCRILTKEQLNPKYSIMIPFMAGILYGNIENEKDSSGSGLLYFWKQLQSLPLQMIPIHQIMLHIRCLDACKADTESEFLSPQLKGYHKTLIYSFKEWLKAWATPDKVTHSRRKRIADRPLNKTMEMYLPNLQYVLVHPDIHSYVTDYFKYCKCRISETQKNGNRFDGNKRALIKHIFNVLPYLCVSTETSRMLVECLRYEFIDIICKESHGMISMKLKEDQLNEVLTSLLNGLLESKYANSTNVKSFGEMVINLDEEKLSNIFCTIMNKFKEKKLPESCVGLLAKIAVQLGDKFLPEAFDCLTKGSRHWDIWQSTESLEMFLIETYAYNLNTVIDGLDYEGNNINRICANVMVKISKKLKEDCLKGVLISLMKKFDKKDKLGTCCEKAFEEILSGLNEEQVHCSFECLKDGLKDDRKNLRNQCVKWIGTLSKKWNREQLDCAFKCLMDTLVNDDNKLVHWSCMESIKDIFKQLNEEQLKIALKELMKTFKIGNKKTRQACVDLLEGISILLNQLQSENLLKYLVMKAIQQTLSAQLQINEKLVNATFEYLMEGFNDTYKNVQYLCTESIGKLAKKFNKDQMETAFKRLLNKFKNNKDNLVRMSCAESLGRMAMAININQTQLENALHALTLTNFKKKQLNNTVKELLNGLKDKDDSIFFCCVGVLPEYLADAFKCLINGLEDKDYIRSHCDETLEKIVMELNEQQVDIAFDHLLDGYKQGKSITRHVCGKLLGNVVSKLNEQQLDDTFKYLISRLNDKDDKTTLRTIALKLKREQLNTVFVHLIDGINDNNNQVCSFCVETLGVFAINLNDKQLYQFVTKVLQILQRSHDGISLIINELLSEFSDDMWQRIVMKSLKEYKKKRKEKKSQSVQPLNKNKETEDSHDIMEALAFGLLTYNPRISFNSYDENTPSNSYAFNTLKKCCEDQAIKWEFPTNQKWKTFDNIPRPSFSSSLNTKKYKSYDIVCEAAKSGNISLLKLALKRHHVVINEVFNKDGYSLLLLAIQNKHWNIVRYFLEQGARVDVRGGIFNAERLPTPIECIIQQISEEKEEDKVNEINMCEFLLNCRTVYPMEQIEYAIDYVKDKLIDENGVKKDIDEKNYEILLQEGAAFLLGETQKNLEEILHENNSLYWAASRDIKSIEFEESKEKRFDEGWYPSQFLIYRIFLLFEICVRLKRGHIELPKKTTFEQVYEKGVKELQVQLTTHWDYITTRTLSTKLPKLIDIWSCNVVDHLIHLKSGSFNECSEISLVVGFSGHTIYLSLCKTSDSILVRVDNQLMVKIPSNTSHPKNNDNAVQPYLLAYFQLNNINQNKIWLKDYIKKAVELRDAESEKSMQHLYCGNEKFQHNNSPREGEFPEIAKKWPYLPVQIDAENCYLRSHNVGYCIRMGKAIYEWFYKQEAKSFLFGKSFNL